MDNHPQAINNVSTCLGIDTGDKMKKHHIEEAEKRFKKAEQDCLHTSEKYKETNSKLLDLYDERRRATNLCHSAAEFINWCKNVVEKLQKALDKLPTTKEDTIDHVMDCEAIRDVREFNQDLYYMQRKMPRSDSRKAVNDLLKEVKEKNKCRGKALTNYTLVSNPTNHDSLRKSVEQEIKVLKKLIKELQKDWEEKLHIKQYARNICKDFKRKEKHLEKKKEHLSGRWDEARKYMFETKKKT